MLKNTFSFFGGSQSGNFVGNVAPGTPLTESPIIATAGSAYSFTSSVGSFSGLVTGTPILLTQNALSRTLSLFVLGIFTPAGTLSGFTAGSLTETFSFTETDTTSGFASFSFSATLASVGNPTPEPWAVTLFGVGLLGLALARRRA